MKRVDDFRLRFGKQELVPIMIGGMGVDISTADLALEVRWKEPVSRWSRPAAEPPSPAGPTNSGPGP